MVPAMLPLTLFLAKGLNVSRFSLLMAMNKQAMLAAIDDLARSRTDVDWRLVASIST